MATLVIDRSRDHNWIDGRGKDYYDRTICVDWYDLASAGAINQAQFALRNLFFNIGGYRIYLLSDNERVDLRVESAFKVLHHAEHRI